MAVKITLNSPTPAGVPADGWIVGYKILGNPGAYTVSGPFVSMPIEINTADPVGTLYEGYIQRDCGALTSTFFFWQTPCGCTTSGYIIAPSGIECVLNESIPPTITNSGYCLATSQNVVYSTFESRIYNSGFNTGTLNLLPYVSDPEVYADLTLSGQWQNTGSSISVGPLNREGVWIDSNCDGSPNALSPGVQTTIAYAYNNVLLVPKTIYIGVGGDNQFQVVVNGTQVADSGTGGDRQFKIWHIIPVTVVAGINFINVIGTGDGSINDAVGMVIYDNTAAEIAAATTDLDLNIPFHSASLRGTSFDVSTCPTDYSLDTTAGPGNYVCRKTTYKECNTLV
jgi:hypothetical protein